MSSETLAQVFPQVKFICKVLFKNLYHTDDSLLHSIPLGACVMIKLLSEPLAIQLTRNSP